MSSMIHIVKPTTANGESHIAMVTTWYMIRTTLLTDTSISCLSMFDPNRLLQIVVHPDRPSLRRSSSFVVVRPGQSSRVLVASPACSPPARPPLSPHARHRPPPTHPLAFPARRPRPRRPPIRPPAARQLGSPPAPPACAASHAACPPPAQPRRPPCLTCLCIAPLLCACALLIMFR